MKPTVIIGGGIVGLFTAYYLRQEGHEVMILDKGDLQVNCSTGNAGMIVPSHIMPLASPGMIGKGLSWMLSSKSPFYIHPKWDRKLLQWCLLFYRSANPKQVEKSIPFLKNLSLYSKTLYLEFQDRHPEAGIGLVQKGLMMLFQSAEGEAEETEFAALAQKNGIEAEVLSPADIARIEPNQPVNARGAVLFPGDAHLSPVALHTFLRQFILAQGITIQTRTKVKGFEQKNGTITSIITEGGSIEADKVILCGGAWSAELAAMMGLNLPLMGGKGYSFMQNNQPRLQQASILTDMKVSMTPYEDQVRFGGTMEIAGTNESINLKRVKGIFEAINRYYPEFRSHFPEQEAIWQGLRPCSPDGLPYIGQAPHLKNVWVGSGHAMMGVSLAPATGKILSSLIADQVPAIKIEGFKVSRF